MNKFASDMFDKLDPVSNNYGETYQAPTTTISTAGQEGITGHPNALGGNKTIGNQRVPSRHNSFKKKTRRKPYMRKEASLIPGTVAFGFCDEIAYGIRDVVKNF